MTRTALPLLLALLAAAPGAAQAPAGKYGREQLAHQLERREYGGRSFTWPQYAAWGRELLVKGSVAAPPVGPAPSARLSKSYRCVHCHNLVPEGRDPEERERLLRSMAPAHAGARDGTLPLLLPGTTFHGIVNRSSFYNGFYAKYRRLAVPDGRAMNPQRLQDAIQVCSRYCSAGRFVEPWEMDSLLAALWEMELTPDEAERAPAVAGADLAETPKELLAHGDRYPGGRFVAGDAARGALVFAASCGGCHGGDVDAPSPAKLSRRAREDGGFARPPRRGTERLGGLYMPLFTAQRLSDRQLADVRAYLASLAR